MNRIVWLCILLCPYLPVFSQIKGVVVDEKTQQPLPDTYILTDSGSYVTDPLGRFIIQSAVKKLIVNHLGYLPDTLIIGSEDTMVTIQLVSKATLLGQITIRGNLQKTPVLEMPSSIGYISNLEQQLPNTISYIENLNQIPGVYAHTGALNTNRITIRGIGSRTPYATNRIKAYYNEIPLTTGDGTTEIEDLNVSSIGSIEILKGSKSALYGSGIGGVVVLNPPEYNDGIHGYARLDIASYQSITLGAGLHYRKKGFFTSVNYSDVRSEGWRENSEYDRRNFNLNTGYSWTKSTLELTLLTIDTRANIPSSLNEEQFINAPESAAQNWLDVKGYESYMKLIGGIKFKHYFNANLQNAIHLFVHRYEGYESRPFNILDDDSQNWGLRNITSLQWTKFKVQLGIETLFENYSWGIYETYSGIQGQQKQQFSEWRNPLTIFVNGQYQLVGKAFFEAGLSLNTLNYRLEDNFDDNSSLNGDYRYEWVLSPFVGVNLSVVSGLYIYGSVSHGFSAPSVEETLLPAGAVNPDLKPETGWNVEAGLRYNDASNRCFIDACVYQLWVNNLLVTKRETEDIFYGANAGKTRHIGFEFNSSIRLNNSESKYSLVMNASYNTIKATFTDFIDDGVDYSGSVLPGIPQHNAWVAAILKVPMGLYFLPQYQFTGNQFLNDANDLKYTGFHLVHLKTGYIHKIKRITMDISIGVKNVFDESYAAMILVNAPSFGGNQPRYYYPGMPRNYYFSLKIIY